MLQKRTSDVRLLSYDCGIGIDNSLLWLQNLIKEVFITYTLLGGLITLILLYCLCTASTVALRKSRKSRLNELKDTRAFGARLALVALDATDRLQMSLQFTSYIAAIFSGAFLFYLVPLVWGFDAPTALIAVAEVLSVLFCLFVGLLCSQLGRAMAYRMPERVLLRLCWFVILVGNISFPFVRLLSRAVDRVLSGWKIPMPTEQELAASHEEISEIVARSSEAGAIDPEERELIQGALAFSDTVVREVMTPRGEIVAIGMEESLEAIVSVLSKEGVSRILISGDNIDDVKGVVLAKDLLPLMFSEKRSEFKLSDHLRPAYIVPESKKVDELLSEFRRKGIHFAVVLNEMGGVDGVVTLEDLLEELVGEIVDEHDKPGSEIKVRKTKSGDLLVSGAALVDDLNRQYGLAIPLGEYDSLGGFLINCTGHIPQPGELIERAGMRFRVEEVSRKRITLVRVHQDKKGSMLEEGAGAEREASVDAPRVATRS